MDISNTQNFEQNYGPDIMGFYDVMDLALSREKEAYQTYIQLSAKMHQYDAAEAFLKLAEEELEHIASLEEIIDKGPGSFHLRTVKDNQEQTTPLVKNIHKDSPVSEVLLYAIFQEHKEYLFYKEMASQCHNKETRDMLVKLSRIELDHKNRLEKIYKHYFNPL